MDRHIVHAAPRRRQGLAQAAGEQVGLLHHHRELFADALEADVSVGRAVDQEPAIGRVVEAKEER